MKKKFTFILALILGFAMSLCLIACGGETSSVGDVSKIQVTTLPTKSEYFVGETFSAAGGKITVTYADGTTAEVELTDSAVTLGEVNTDKTGEKTVTVQYGGKRTTFKIVVKVQGFDVTFDYNYDGGTSKVVTAEKNKAVAKPADPTRDGYAFYSWYADEACTVPFDFAQAITKNTTIYAYWKQDGATYFDVTYDLNYYGITPQSYKQAVKSGDAARALAITPARDEYSFDGWYGDEACTAAYVATTPITANTTVYAKWTKTKSVASTYIFEAENTSLKNKTGPGFSGTSSEEAMIIANATASNGKCVSYMYQNNNSLEFYLACDEDVSDVTLVLSLAAEMENIAFSDSEFLVIVNEETQSYSDVALPNNATFSDAVTISNVSLKKGANLIQLKVNNSKRPMGDASTYSATAPMIDCIKLTTTAVVTWDAVRGLPVQY